MTHIVRWKPFGSFIGLTGPFDRFFDDAFTRLQNEEGTVFTSAWSPAIDTLETDDALLLRADIPGVDPKDVDIEVHDNVLTLKGERKVESDVKEDNFHRVERAYGSFSRSFTLPRTVDTGKVEAGYDKGVLEIRLPKRPEAKPRQIKVAVSQN